MIFGWMLFNKERTKMVKTMTRIYRDALFVVVWLRPSTSLTSLAIGLIRSLAAKASPFEYVQQ